MVRSLWSVLGFLLVVPGLWSQDLGRTDRFFRDYLSETVKRGLTLSASETAVIVPYWPDLERDRIEAASLEPGPDTELLGAWLDLQQGVVDPALETLQRGWPKPELARFSARDWGETLFAIWRPEDDPQTWTQAWLAWEEKAYSPRGLIRGLEVLERTDASAVLPLLSQALELHADDRRFLPLIVRNPDSVASSQALVTRDLVSTGGWSQRSVRELLNRDPGAKETLAKAGYPPAQLDAVLARDYSSWLATDRKLPPADGEWFWDSDQDGVLESRLVFDKGSLASWTRDSQDGGLWSLAFVGGQPSQLTETRGGATWTLDYAAYPLARTLEYRWGSQRIVYRFRPLAENVPLWPAERFEASLNSLPPVLADLWLPLDPKALATVAATVETWDDGQKVRTVFLFRGQVWLSIEDMDRNGHSDTWSYFRDGRLVSVYRDTEGSGRANIRELYKKGELTQVQSKALSGKGTEFVLFPAEGVQLWDPHGNHRPLERLFVWPGQGELTALVFSGSAMPWSTMPPWEDRP